MSYSSLPVVVIGAGPVGLAAAAHLLDRGFTPLVLEGGTEVGAGIRQWAHVRLFSPWECNVDKRASEILAAHGWEAPNPKHLPTGQDVIERYLVPLANTLELAPLIHLNSRVIAVSKQGRDRMKNSHRDDVPFVVRYLAHGEEHEVFAQAVIDASGTIETPNPLGASGIPALGERRRWESIFYGIPDVMVSHRSRYAGKRVLVVGSGHSAFNALIDLARLNREVPGGQIHWAVRRPSLLRVLSGSENDQLKERGQLGLRVAKLAGEGAFQVQTGFHLDRIEHTASGLVAWSGETALPPVDEIVGATGFRPDLTILGELHLDLDSATQSPSTLAPLIDPSLHSCSIVRPHGAEELRHPEANLYVVGMKSYGRAPAFLMLTGYEQVRSVVAAIAGDWEAARRVERVLPGMDACSTQFADKTCVKAPSYAGGRAPVCAEACCAKDLDAWATSDAGSGCSATSAVTCHTTAAKCR